MTDVPFTQHTVALDSGPVTYLKGGEGRAILHLHPAGGMSLPSGRSPAGACSTICSTRSGCRAASHSAS